MSNKIMGEKIPVDILTGFLGSGKTTLLNRVLRDGSMTGAMALINEFGEIGIDHELVAGRSDIISLPSGCLCCAVRGELSEALEDLYRRRTNGEIDFERIIIETTGLADPKAVLEQLTCDLFVARRYWTRSVITTIDAVFGGVSLDRYREAATQAAVADHIVLTKCDLVDQLSRTELMARLRSFNPLADIVESFGDGPPFGAMFAITNELSARSSDWLTSLDEFEQPERWETAEAKGQARHDNRVTSLSHASRTPVPCAVLDHWISEVFRSCGPNLLRMKAIVHIAEMRGPVVLHAVQGVIHPPEMLAKWPSEDRRTRIVLIGFDLDLGGIINSLEEMCQRARAA